MKAKLAVTLLILVACVSCRSIDAEARGWHDDAKSSHEDAVVVLNNVLDNAPGDFTQEQIDALKAEFVEHMTETLDKRQKLQNYFIDEKWPNDAIYGHGILLQLEQDLWLNHENLFGLWQQLDGDALDVAKFKEDYRQAITRSNELLRKVDEYVRQFKVKGE